MPCTRAGPRGLSGCVSWFLRVVAAGQVEKGARSAVLYGAGVVGVVVRGGVAVVALFQEAAVTVNGFDDGDVAVGAVGAPGAGGVPDDSADTRRSTGGPALGVPAVFPGKGRAEHGTVRPEGAVQD